jgi:hypothetical protein
MPLCERGEASVVGVGCYCPIHPGSIPNRGVPVGVATAPPKEEKKTPLLWSEVGKKILSSKKFSYATREVTIHNLPSHGKIPASNRIDSDRLPLVHQLSSAAVTIRPPPVTTGSSTIITYPLDR